MTSPETLQRIQSAALQRAAELGKVLTTLVTYENVTSAPPRVYGADLSGCWIAYLQRPVIDRLESSYILAFDPVDGRLVYEGSAYDEG